MILRLAKCLTVTGLIAALAACSAVPLDNSSQQNANAHGATTGSDQNLDPFNPQSILAQQHSIYFDFDSYSVSDQYKQLSNQHASYLAMHPQRRIRLEGHTDYRGSEEYNLALGQRRAEAVGEIFTLNGAAPAQIEMISFGKVQAHKVLALDAKDETIRSHDRRVDIIYQP